MKSNKRSSLLAAALVAMLVTATGCSLVALVDDGIAVAASAYPVVDTHQALTYDHSAVISAPPEGSAFFGQDAQYTGNTPHYVDNGDGTVTDLVTGLMWQQSVGDKVTYSQAVAGADSFSLAGHSDWRLPTIKELYSLIDFSGLDVSPESASGSTPFIDASVFDFEYGDTAAGERIIDAQWVSSTAYVAGDLVFGVNFADGRIKGYGFSMPGGGEKSFFVRYVRGNTDYGENDFIDNGDGTVTDLATGLMWMQGDSGVGMDWEAALAWAEDSDLAGYGDWRLPNAKELQSIVDYTRSPSTSGSPAIDPIFDSTSIVDESGGTNWPFYWTGTTHASQRSGDSAVYIAFGEALGYMNGRWVDIHGAGAQRSDPKAGSASQYLFGRGPQGDAVRIDNFVRAVRDAN